VIFLLNLSKKSVKNQTEFLDCLGIFKNNNYDRTLLLQLSNTHSLRNEILNLIVQNGFEDDCYVDMLDFTIDLFESQGLGADYYGYHNINHELEVTYVSLLAAKQDRVQLTDED